MRTAALAVLVWCSAFAQTAPTLSVDASAGRHPINPGVYGLNWDFDDEGTAGTAALDHRLSVRRWGGNWTSRYNWKLDVKNHAADWFFMVPPDGKTDEEVARLPEGSLFNTSFEHWTRSGARVVGAVPILEWLPKARSKDKQCSFSVARYGSQCAVELYDQDCGNGLRFVNGCPGATMEPWKSEANPSNAAKIQNDPNDVSARFDELFQRDWVKYLVGRYGPANRGGVAYWSLDNEPDWWFSSHRDVHPVPQTYDETFSQGLKYARAVKDADPSALVTGPVSSGWQSLFYSAADIQAGWNSGRDWYSNPVDRNAHGGMAFVPWYLQKFRDAERSEGRRLLDVLDIHGYVTPDNLTDATRMTSTRAFWDPNYKYQTYWIVDTKTRGPMATRLIPMLREWIDQYYPETKLAITEYDWGAHSTMPGGIAQADILGIFGREGVDVGTLWTSLKTTDPTAFAFRLYRNYDGIGGAFGETSVQATTSDADRLSIFAAQRSDSMLTVVVLNKTANDVSTTVALNGFAPGDSAKVWRYAGANKTAIVKAADAPVSGSGVSATFPAYSMTMLVIPPAQFAVGKPVVLALQNAASYRYEIAPGQLVVVWGANLGPKHLTQPGPEQIDSNGMYRDTLADVRVLFDGIPGRPVYVRNDVAAVVVPYFGATKATTHVQVEYQGVRSDPFEIAVTPTAPGMFTDNQQGSGNGAIQVVEGEQLVRNGSDHPAHAGGVAVLWLTGEGITNPPGIDGRPATDILPKPVGEVEVQIGGLKASVEYAGAVPTLIPGVFQVNARLDAAVQPNDRTPVKVRVGANWSQDNVTMVVR